MSELQQDSKKLVMEECTSPQIDKRIKVAVKTSMPTVEKTAACPKSSERGDGSGTSILAYSPFNVLNIGVAALCSVDKMRIDHLVSELNKCMEAKKETELLLETSKSENEDITKTFESCDSKHEADKEILESELSAETTEFNQLTTKTSYALKILTDQISAWGLETSLITDTVNELLAQKIHLETEISRMGIKTMILAGEESRMEDRVAMEKLCLKNHKLKADMTLTLTFDRSCQTEESSLRLQCSAPRESKIGSSPIRKFLRLLENCLEIEHRSTLKQLEQTTKTN